MDEHLYWSTDYVVVDPACGDASKEGKRQHMRVEKHFLFFGAHIRPMGRLENFSDIAVPRWKRKASAILKELIRRLLAKLYADVCY